MQCVCGEVRGELSLWAVVEFAGTTRSERARLCVLDLCARGVCYSWLAGWLPLVRPISQFARWCIERCGYGGAVVAVRSQLVASYSRKYTEEEEECTTARAN